MEAFIRGGAGEIDVNQLPAIRGRGFVTKADKEAAAAAYEEKNPNVVVRRDWEQEAEHEARRSARKVASKPAVSEGMDPEMARRELKRVYLQIGGLEPSHPQYDKLWRNLTDAAHRYEDICEIPRTPFTKGVQPRKADDPVDPELQDKLNKYSRLKAVDKRTVIERAKDTNLLKLIRDNEPARDLQDMAVARLLALGAF
jgi:hypothetical protein